MKRCIAMILAATAFGCFATNSKAQGYKPCFEDPVFVDAAFTRPDFVEPQFEPDKRIQSQFEKTVIEAPVFERRNFETAIIVKPEFVVPQFEGGCKKSSVPMVPQKVDWFAAKIAASKTLAAHPSNTSKPAKTAKAETRLLAVNKIR